MEMVDSVDDPKYSRSLQGYTHFQNSEMLDARIASSLNEISQYSNVKKKVSLNRKLRKRIRSFTENRSRT